MSSGSASSLLLPVSFVFTSADFRGSLLSEETTGAVAPDASPPSTMNYCRVVAAHGASFKIALQDGHRQVSQPAQTQAGVCNAAAFGPNRSKKTATSICRL